eukprot:1194295-Prorocentrum_minimum.AAC.1
MNGRCRRLGGAGAESRGCSRSFFWRSLRSGSKAYGRLHLTDKSPPCPACFALAGVLAGRPPEAEHAEPSKRVRGVRGLACRRAAVLPGRGAGHGPGDHAGGQPGGAGAGERELPGAVGARPPRRLQRHAAPRHRAARLVQLH